jgi:hypothetical protein
MARQLIEDDNLMTSGLGVVAPLSFAWRRLLQDEKAGGLSSGVAG